MDIYINNAKVEFTLNGEQTAADIQRGMNAFLTQHERVLVSFAVDGDQTPAGLARPVNEIKEIRVESENVNELVTATLRSAADYLDKIDKVMADIGAYDQAQQDIELGLVRKDLADGLLVIVRLLESSAQVTRLVLPELTAVCAQVKDAATALQQAPDEAAAGKVVRGQLAPLLPEMRRQHAALALAGNAGKLRRRQLRDKFDRFAQELPALGEAFTQTAVHLQTGAEIKGLQVFQEAVGTLQDFINMLQEFQRLGDANFASLTTEDKTLAEWVQDFLLNLKSIVETFAKRDYVLLADLLEYEMAPRLARWQRILKILEPHLPPVD